MLSIRLRLPCPVYIFYELSINYEEFGREGWMLSSEEDATL